MTRMGSTPWSSGSWTQATSNQQMFTNLETGFRLGLERAVSGASQCSYKSYLWQYKGSIATSGTGWPSGQQLLFVDFDVVQIRCLPYSARAVANLAELACHVGNTVELPNQSHQNIVAELIGHPVDFHKGNSDFNYNFDPDFVWAGNKRPNPIHPNNENVLHEIEMPTLPKSRKALLSFNYVCGTDDTAATSKAHCKIEIFFRCVINRKLFFTVCHIQTTKMADVNGSAMLKYRVVQNNSCLFEISRF